MTVVTIAYLIVLLIIFALHIGAYWHADKTYRATASDPTPLPGFDAIYYYQVVTAPLITILSVVGPQTWPYVLYTVDSPLGVRIGGLLLTVCGLTGLWTSLRYLGQSYSPCSEPRLPAAIVDAGPYKFIRHPIFVSNMIMLLGLAAFAGSGLLLLNLAILYWCYSRIADAEEQSLAHKFPGYSDYVHNTGRFIPVKAERALRANRFEWVSMIFSIVALVAALVGHFVEPRRRSEDLTSGVIREVYQDYLDMLDGFRQSPLQSHLFVLKHDYPQIKGRVQAALKEQQAPAAKSLLLLEERMLADRIFTMFERTLYLKRLAEDNGDVRREKFLDEVLGYYTGRLLLNPRLLWYWSKDGGRLLEHYETTTIEYYNNAIDVKKHASDATGPFK